MNLSVDLHTSVLREDPIQQMTVEFFKNFEPNSGWKRNCSPPTDDCGFLMDSFQNFEFRFEKQLWPTDMAGPGKNEQNLRNLPVILSNPWTLLAKLLWEMYQPIPDFLTFPNYIPTFISYSAEIPKGDPYGPPGGYNTSKSPSQIG